MANRVETIYLDDQRRKVPRKQATQFVRRVLDGRGKLVLETFGILSGAKG